ncbi:MAG: CPBP family intramembrane metalloprotease [Bacteroidota bacterium]|nr:CPBP family intramembrane metalloprotease [Bacteroidota bacterium]
MKPFGSLRYMSPGYQLLFAVLISICSFVIFSFLSMASIIPFYGMKVLTDPGFFTDYSRPESINVLKYMQVMQSVGLFIIPSIFLAYIFGDKIGTYLKMNRGFKLLSIVLLFVLIVSSNPVINFLAELNTKLVLPSFLSPIEKWMRASEDNAALLTKAFLNVSDTKGLFINLLMIGIIPAVGEEFLFRGVIQKIFTKMTKNIHWGIWISAGLFSAMHLQFFGFLPRIVLGAMFGYLLAWSGCLWLPVIAHFLNNSLAVIFYYLNSKGMTNLSLDQIGTKENSYPLVIISFAFVILLLIWIHRLENRKQPIVD